MKYISKLISSKSTPNWRTSALRSALLISTLFSTFSTVFASKGGEDVNPFMRAANQMNNAPETKALETKAPEVSNDDPLYIRRAEFIDVSIELCTSELGPSDPLAPGDMNVAVERRLQDFTKDGCGLTGTAASEWAEDLPQHIVYTLATLKYAQKELKNVRDYIADPHDPNFAFWDGIAWVESYLAKGVKTLYKHSSNLKLIKSIETKEGQINALNIELACITAYRRKLSCELLKLLNKYKVDNNPMLDSEASPHILPLDDLPNLPGTQQEQLAMETAINLVELYDQTMLKLNNLDLSNDKNVLIKKYFRADSDIENEIMKKYPRKITDNASFNKALVDVVKECAISIMQNVVNTYIKCSEHSNYESNLTMSLIRECCRRDANGENGINDRLRTFLALNDPECLQRDTLTEATSYGESWWMRLPEFCNGLYLASSHMNEFPDVHANSLKIYIIMSAARGESAGGRPMISPFHVKKSGYNFIPILCQMLNHHDDQAIAAIEYAYRSDLPRIMLVYHHVIYMLLLAIKDTKTFGFQSKVVNNLIEIANKDPLFSDDNKSLFAQLPKDVCDYYILRQELIRTLLKKQKRALKKSNLSKEAIKTIGQNIDNARDNLKNLVNKYIWRYYPTNMPPEVARLNLFTTLCDNMITQFSYYDGLLKVAQAEVRKPEDTEPEEVGILRELKEKWEERLSQVE